MRIGVLEVRLNLPGVRSLKEKRGIVKGLLERIRNRFQVAAAEVDEINSKTPAGLGFSAVGNDSGTLQSRLRKVVEFIDAGGEGTVADFRVEILS